MAPLSLIFCLLLLAIGVEATPCPVDRLWYSTKYTLDPLSGYSIALRAEAEILHIVLEIAATGWMGFGIAEQSTGTMLGSDIVTVAITNGQVQMQDCHTMWYPSNWPTPPAGVFPFQDQHNDWTVVAGFEVNGKTAVHLTRPLVTGDTQDRDIRHGPQRIIWAHGPTDTVEYHSTRRGATAIIFIPDDNNPKDDDRTEVTQAFPKYDGMASIRIQYAIPEVRTAYGCQAFRLPEDKRRHVVAIRPHVDKTQMVVMGTVYVCGESPYWKGLQRGQACLGNRPLSNWDNDCQGILFTWARAGEVFILPPEVGIPIGRKNDAATTIVLEIHYDNPTLMSGQVDTSGLDLFYVDEIRQWDAGVLMLGDASLKFAAMPPMQPSIQRASACPSRCTAHFDGPIHVFGSVLHMRSTGHRMWTTQYDRNLRYLRTTNRADFWRMGVRPFTPRSYDIHPGDFLFTHCEYNTTLKATATSFGPQSADEICVHYLFYYPAQYRELKPFTFCGWSPGDETLCANDIAGSWSVILEDSSLQIPDPENHSADPTNFGPPNLQPSGSVTYSVCDPENLTEVLLRDAGNDGMGLTLWTKSRSLYVSLLVMLWWILLDPTG